MPLRPLVTLLLCSTVASSQATTWPQVALSDLYSNSDVVVFALITSGDLVEGAADSSRSCGVKHVAEVRGSYKGQHNSGALLNFSGAGLEVGREYLLFLSDGETYEPISSISSPQVEARMEWERWSEENCASMPKMKVNLGGRGALPVIWTLRWKSRGVQDAVLARRRYLLLPIEVPKGPFGELDEMYPYAHEEWTVWNKGRLEEWLGKLSEGAGASP